MEEKLKGFLQNLINSENPSRYFNENKEILSNSTLHILYQLQDVPQEKKFHPEGNVWNHVMMVIDNAAKVKDLSENKQIFMLAALFHDIGKISTTKTNKTGRLISYNHDSVGADLCEKVLNKLDFNRDTIDGVINLVKYHMHHIYILKDLPFGNKTEMVEDTSIKDILLLFFCDKAGRGGNIDVTNILNDLQEIIHKLNIDSEMNETLMQLLKNIAHIFK